MEILILASLIVLNGLFAMSEVALLTARKSRLSQLAQDGDHLAAAALRLAGDDRHVGDAEHDDAGGDVAAGLRLQPELRLQPCGAASCPAR